MIRLRKGFKKFDYEQWSEQREKEKMELYMKLSPEERLRIDTLNVELKQFGFSLDSSIDEVFEKYYKEELQNGKIQRLKYVPPDAYNNVLSLYLAELKEETKHKESNSTYDTVRVTAYDITTFPHTENHVANRQLSGLQLYLYEQHSKYPPTTTPERHIELCLRAITRGVELAKFIPQLEAEINRGSANSLNEIPKSELEKIFNASKIADFRKLEQILFNRNYIDVNRKWLHKAPELIALILCLQEEQNHYFKKSVTNKQIKDFFQGLYQIDIRQQYEPERRNKISQSDKEVFQNIIDSLP